MKRKKILILIGYDFRVFGGMDRVIFNLMEFINNNNLFYEVEVLSIKYLSNPKIKDYYFVGDYKNFNIYKLFRFNYWGLRGGFYTLKGILGLDIFYGYKELYDFFKSRSYDIILVLNGIFLNSIHKVFNDLSYSIPIVYWDHGDLLSFSVNVKNIFLKFLRKTRKNEVIKGIKKTKYFFCISTYIKDLILKLNPLAEVYLVYNPVEIQPKTELIDRGENNILLYVGRISDFEKNLTFMLKGLSKLKDCKWKLKVIGEGKDLNKLISLANILGIAERIDFEGFKINPYENLKEVKVLLLTSRYEGFGMVLVEANAKGIPFLAPDCPGGIKDIVIEGVNGYLYKEGNIEDFVDKLRKILIDEMVFAKPEEIHETAKKFDKNKVLANIISIIEKIINA